MAAHKQPGAPYPPLGPDVGQGARRVGQGINLELAPEHGRRQQHADYADKEPADDTALYRRMVLLQLQ